MRKRLLPLYLGATVAADSEEAVPTPTPTATALIVPGLPFAPHACLVGEGRGSKVAVGDSVMVEGKAKAIGKVSPSLALV